MMQHGAAMKRHATEARHSAVRRRPGGDSVNGGGKDVRHTSASHASAIDEKIREHGPYAVSAGRFDTEWGCEKDHFFVGTDEQVAVAGSADALERIRNLAPKLRGDDITAPLNVIICDTQMPACKKKCLEKSGSLCPFCESSGLSSGPVQTDGSVGWADVECEGCGASWQDVRAMTDMTEVKEKSGGKTES